ncbi:FkbM family methyltransferase [Thermopetrobacter sp. TC1]|uniref:FkbM family methyltransferase n=1 Tax=Thermopetrobacter sp. TC1 TaxID=1495045 RepID=UPI0009DE48AD|nr:FkbM family methyltransferase [Thermopetrobacter sp. TC1]
MYIKRDNNLIFDIGMHKALDTEFYLKKGFNVVAVEANPQLVEDAKCRLYDYIKEGRLTILNLGISPTEGKLTFYINLENDEWSSFNKNLGTRDNTRYETIEVDCVTPMYLFTKFGIPYYVKVDIEGYDVYVINTIKELKIKPKYASIEDSGIDSLISFYNSGCRKFKLLNQIDKWKIQLPNPALEGNYISDYSFGACTSGPFGDEVPGRWLSIDEVMYEYLNKVRKPGEQHIIQHGWWDIHGCYE